MPAQRGTQRTEVDGRIDQRLHPYPLPERLLTRQRLEQLVVPGPGERDGHRAVSFQALAYPLDAVPLGGHGKLHP